ncbi:hypothetical protein K491DRAFT_63204 [Lophiostoma macrostomum CBS 122681]|uniref:Uncharacterized protein n=1 Tax=Lophiostoma macrostomum CBS 122681 TaxID=1314788 RepID=A0A6A6TLF0_9PLEO|nr:hypothetical protein K491DRAFT_63204 [Lophiostoma macrostomum CBS 122681]
MVRQTGQAAHAREMIFDRMYDRVKDYGLLSLSSPDQCETWEPITVSMFHERTLTPYPFASDTSESSLLVQLADIVQHSEDLHYSLPLPLPLPHPCPLSSQFPSLSPADTQTTPSLPSPPHQPRSTPTAATVTATTSTPPPSTAMTVAGQGTMRAMYAARTVVARDGIGLRFRAGARTIRLCDGSGLDWTMWV